MGKIVLVADDSSTMRKIILRSLQAVGVPDAVDAADGVEAVAKFQQHSIDLVLTDYNMPKMDGEELLKYIRQHNELELMPVIMVVSIGRMMQVNHGYVPIVMNVIGNEEVILRK